MYVKKKKEVFYKTDYGKIGKKKVWLKYREKYRSTDISVDL